MSQVWRAHDSTLDRTIALKLLSPTADLDRFRREAQSVAALAHENVVRVYDYGEDEAGRFMALEWLPGGTLEERIAGSPLPPDEIYRIARGIAAGLAHLHARGLVHRDLKPANVLFDEEGRPKVGDFGLARRAAGAGTLTEAGTVLGTAAYLSPEQAGAEPVGPASDVYSFGVILFRMLTGALPFVAEEPLALMNMHRNAPPPTVADLQPDAPPELAALAAAALQKDPARRPADGSALLVALGEAPTALITPADTAVTRVLAPVPLEEAAGATPPPRSSRPLWREPAAIAAAVVLLAVGGGLLAWAITRPDSSTPGPSTTAHTHANTATTHTQPPPTTTAPPTTTQPPTTTTAPPTTTRPPTTTAPPPTTIPPPTTATIPPTTTILPPTTTAPTGTTVP